MIEVCQSNGLRRAYKRLNPNQKADVDDAVSALVKDPAQGEAKKGGRVGQICSPMFRSMIPVLLGQPGLDDGRIEPLEPL
ncbi:MAG: type II toxin-antitoxin system RelE/ParE family toxin, partial [Halochromatium sp.]|uniref:type II toxin-antitoxin system RelE/ParE family toxin n=1 Tax=Halochromatium sp. TaxID=2049430 RepID=UPI0039781D92